MNRSYYFLILTIFLISCGSINDVPEQLKYDSTEIDPRSAAVLTGSRKPDPIKLFDPHIVYPYSIDGKIVSSNKKNWDTPILLSPGVHKIGIQYVMGAWVAKFEIEYDFEANRTYFIDQAVKRTKHIDYWLADKETGEPVSDVDRELIGAPGISIIPFL